MQPSSGGVPTRQRGFPKCPAVLGWVAAGQNGFLQFAEEPFLVCYPSWRSFPLLLRTACYSGTKERTSFRSRVLPHMTLVASCGVFVVFRDAERSVFRARTDPKDAMPRRRCGEGRANITSSEAELNGRLRPSNRGRRHGVAAAEPPVRTRIFVFQPGGLGWTG